MDNLQVKEYLTQGTVLAGQGKYDEAIAYYDKAEKEAPAEIDVYLNKGIAYANMNNLAEAKTQFEKALKISRASGVAYFHLGSIAILNGDVSFGYEMYNKAISNGFDDAQVYFNIGLLNEEDGEFDMAIRNYTKAITKDALRADIRIRKAQLLMEAGRLPEAIQALDETILTNPDIFEGYHLKFMLLLQMKQFDDAEKTLELATELFPEDPAFMLDKSTLLSALGRSDEALAFLNEIEKIEDSNVKRSVYMERAKIYTEREDVQSAIGELEKAHVMAEGAGEFDDEAMFLLSNCYLAAENFEKLLDYSRQLMEKANEDYFINTARYYEPLALKKLGRMDEARLLYEEAITEFRNQALSSPGNLDAYLLRTMCLRDLDQNEKALELIDYVIALKPDMPEPRVLRVALLEALGRDDDAKIETKAANAMLPEELKIN